MKLFDSEWKVMEVLWQKNDRTAKEISLRLADTIGWNKNTTYTVIKKCIEKGAIERREPNFICHAQITKQQAQKEEAETLVEKVFDGSAELLFASILSDRSLSKDELARLKALVEAMEDDRLASGHFGRKRADSARSRAAARAAAASAPKAFPGALVRSGCAPLAAGIHPNAP